MVTGAYSVQCLVIFVSSVAESTQTVQALQHANSSVPPGVNNEVEIRSLKSEIDILKKQIAGNRQRTCTASPIIQSWPKGFENDRYLLLLPLRLHLNQLFIGLSETSRREVQLL